MQPSVSVIVPCYNEEATIGALLSAISEQTYPTQNLEILIADGLSTDGTRNAVAEFQRSHPAPPIRVVDNPAKTIPAGLNAAIREARGEILVRLDAHSVPARDYVERCVSDLASGLGSNVGGVWVIQPGGKTWMARAIAAAAAHPLGAGDASYRIGGHPRAVDTVPFGAFRRSLLETVGKFDEGLLTNEDYEFNVRVRRAGGVVWMDPEIQSTYIARATLSSLAGQYWRYGFWKLRMLMRYPESIRWRQAVPALFVLAVLVLGLAAVFWRPAAVLLTVALILYGLALLLAGLDMGARQRDLGLLLGGPLALATMHLSWGTGFWASLLSKWFARNG